MSARDCIARINQAAGRTLTDAEVEGVFSRLHKAALDIKAGRAAPGELKLGRALEKELKGAPGAADARTMYQKAAERAAAELEAEAKTLEYQAHLQLVRMGARMKDTGDMRAAGINPIDAVKGTLARDYTGKVKVESLEQKAMGYADYFKSKLLPAWDALGNDFLGFLQDETKLLNLVREMRGENTGDAMARKGAEVWLKVAEEVRVLFNENGGSIGKLDDWANPQHHSQAKVAAADGIGKDPAAARQVWVDFMMPLMDRKNHFTDDLGNPWDDARLRDHLEHAWLTIATNGHAKITPGEFKGVGKVANRHAEARQLHFKDAESQIAYWERFGEKTVVEILHSHIESMARDIAFVEHYGPNPDTTFRTLREQALKDATTAAPAQTPKLEGQAAKLDQLWNYASGKTKPSFNQNLSGVADALANLNVAGKLGGAMWASFFGDKPLMEAVSHLNDLPMLQRWRYEMGLLNPMNGAERRLLQQQGLMLDGVRSGLQRFYEGLGKSGTTGKIGNAIMRVSGMQAINDIRKGAFGASLMGQIGSMLERGVTHADLATGDVRALRQYGITAHDWNVWGAAKLQDVGFGTRALTPEMIGKITDADLVARGAMGPAEPPGTGDKLRRDAIVKLLGVVNTETEFAVITPGWTERSTFYGDLQRGTMKGEIVRSMLQFKAFPWAQFQRGMDAIANVDSPAGKALMTAYLLMATTLAGAMIMQVREMLAGKDPRPMVPDKNYDKFKFWGAAFLQGGALGIYGDFLSSANQTRYGTGPLEIMAGPTIGPVLSLALVQPMNAAAKTIEGKDTHLAAQTIAQLKGFVPGNNLWYTKAATEHLIWQRVMEAMSQGYLSKMRERSRKEYGQDWWWTPSTAPILSRQAWPERMPDFEKAIK